MISRKREEERGGKRKVTWEAEEEREGKIINRKL